jgi:hypothetical protein
MAEDRARQKGNETVTLSAPPHESVGVGAEIGNQPPQTDTTAAGGTTNALIAEIRRVAAEWERIYGAKNYAPNLALAVQAADALGAREIATAPDPTGGTDHDRH